MIKSWDEIKLLVYKVLMEEFKVYYRDLDNGCELVSEAYIAYDKAVKSYDPTKSQFTTYCMIVVRGHLKDYLRYNSSSIIHVPVKKKDSTTIETFSIYVQNEHGDEYISSIPAHDSDDNSVSLEAFIHVIDSLEGELNGNHLEALKCLKTSIINDEDIKLTVHRQYLAQIRKMIKDKYEKEYN